MKIMKRLLLILVGGILLSSCSDDSEMDDGDGKHLHFEYRSRYLRQSLQEVVTRLAPDPVALTKGP